MWDVEADLRGDCLKILLPEWRYPDAPLHALYHRNRFMAPRVRVLLDFLSERFAQVSDELEGLLSLPPERPRAKATAETASGEGL